VAGQPGVRYSALSTTGESVCAIRAEDGRVQCFGTQHLPEALSRASYRSLSRFGSCGIRDEDGKRICWGQAREASGGDPLVWP
jgi:hypothetical protein